MDFHFFTFFFFRKTFQKKKRAAIWGNLHAKKYPEYLKREREREREKKKRKKRIRYAFLREEERREKREEREREREEKRNGARRSEPKYRRSGRVSAPPLETLRERERETEEREREAAPFCFPLRWRSFLFFCILFFAGEALGFVSFVCFF